MGLSIIRMISRWIVQPLLDLLSHHHSSGKWHPVHLLPVATVVFAFLIWLGSASNSLWLLVIGLVGTFFAGTASVLFFIPRKVEEQRSFKSWLSERSKKGEEIEEAEK